MALVPKDAGTIAIDARRERELSRIAPQLFATTCSPEALPAADSALLAFAQLVACRLDVARCLISFFDRRRQMVVAESTRSSALTTASPRQHARAASDNIWLGGTAILRSQGPCEHVLVAADRHHGQELSVSVVPDLALDARYRDCPGVCDAPYNRFYAGLALRSASGINIGVLCIFDPKPRSQGLAKDQLDCLRTLSHIITSYLELGDSFRALQRSESMVRGLQTFVTGAEAGLDAGQDITRSRALSLATPPSVFAQPWQPNLPRGDNMPNSGPPNDTASPLQRPALDPVPPITSSIHHDSNHLDSSNSIDPTPGSARTIGSTAPKALSSPKKIGKIMQRASEIIRESLDVEGVLFLDASVRSYGALVQDANHDQRSPILKQGPRSDVESAAVQDDQDSGVMCGVLGACPSATVSSQGAPNGTILSENMLRGLLKRYPHGQVFDFDGSEGLSTECHATITPKSSTYEAETPDGTTVIAAMFPEATSVAFVPLWDTRRDRWFSTSFIWTRVPSRSFTTHGELSYLRAFATTIMAEVDRVRTADTESAKSHLLGSLSHEIQTPLHGIVAAVELLHDTELDAFQGDLLQTMDACGRTLLDVIDHLLDYSKINKLIRSTGRQAGKRAGEQRSGNTDRYQSLHSRLDPLSYVIDLDALVEETIESMFTMQGTRSATARVDTYIRKDNESKEAFMPQSLDTATKSARHSGVSIYLLVDPTISWSGRIGAGAVRRIIMNLLGNSLKFTDHGFITVSMMRDDNSVRKSQASIIINVSDTGRGISHDFLQHHAFEPFQQEDPLSQGMGIGLSLVLQVVQTLGGSVRMESQPQRGTSVTATIPFEPCAVLDRRTTQFQQNVAALTGSRVTLRGFKERSEISGIHNHTAPVEAQVMENLCRGWLHLEPIPDGNKEIRPDIIVCADTAMEGALLTSDDKSPPVVVICHNALIAHNLWTKSREDQNMSNFEFISQPIGPRKLANAIILAIGRYNEARAADLVSTEINANGVPDGQSISNSTFDLTATPAQSSLMPRCTPDEALTPLASTDEALGITTYNDPEAIKSSISISATITERSPVPTENMAALEIQEQPREQILLVDDNKINLQILVSFMKKLKRPYQTATNGLEALQAFSANPACFSHVLMDISMPVMDGLESTRGIRGVEAARGQKHHQQQHQQWQEGGTLATSDGDLSPVKVIALTGLVSVDAQQEALASGVDLYMTKPVKFKELSTVLETHKPL